MELIHKYRTKIQTLAREHGISIYQINNVLECCQQLAKVEAAGTDYDDKHKWSVHEFRQLTDLILSECRSEHDELFKIAKHGRREMEKENEPRTDD